MQLTADPFVVLDLDADGIDEFYLKHAGLDGELADAPCVDAGDDATATALGLDWSNGSTRSDGALDISPVDMGWHW